MVVPKGHRRRSSTHPNIHLIVCSKWSFLSAARDAIITGGHRGNFKCRLANNTITWLRHNLLLDCHKKSVECILFYHLPMAAPKGHRRRSSTHPTIHLIVFSKWSFCLQLMMPSSKEDIEETSGVALFCYLRGGWGVLLRECLCCKRVCNFFMESWVFVELLCL